MKVKVGITSYAAILHVLLSITYFIVFVHRLTIPSLGRWIRQQYSVNGYVVQDVDITTGNSIYFWSYGLIQIIVGVVSVYSRIVLPIALFLMAIGSLIIGYSSNIYIMYFASAIVGVGAGFCYLTIVTSLSVWWPKKTFPLVNGLCMFVGYMGGFVSSNLVLGSMGRAIGLANTYLVFSVIAAVTGILFAILARNNPTELGFIDPNGTNSSAMKSDCKENKLPKEEGKEANEEENNEEITKKSDDLQIASAEQNNNNEYVMSNNNIHEDDKESRCVVEDHGSAASPPIDEKEKKKENIFKHQFKYVFSKRKFVSHIFLVGLSQALLMGSYFCNSGAIGIHVVNEIYAIDISELMSEVIHSVLTMTPVLGCLIMPFISNRLGRVMTETICSAALTLVYIGHIIMCLEQKESIAGFVLCNALIGLFVGIAVSSGYTHQKEMFTPDTAGAAMGVHNTLQYVVAGIYNNVVLPIVSQGATRRIGMAYVYILFMSSNFISSILVSFSSETRHNSIGWRMQHKLITGKKTLKSQI